MARELNLTTQKQDFIKESYIKEMQTRINWWRHYRQNMQPVPPIKSKAKGKDHFRLPTIIDSRIQTDIDNKNCMDTKNSQKLRTASRSDEMESSPIESQMKPVSPGTRSLLYHGTSKEEKGRYRYLKIRNSLGPEEKYCYPVATSWVYGWHSGKSSISCVSV